MIVKQLIGLLALSSVTDSHVPRFQAKQLSAEISHANVSAPSSSKSAFRTLKRDGDPASMGWIKRWAAIGDSYTAGIGAGQPTGHRITEEEIAIVAPDGIEEIRNNFRCSRYDASYPYVLAEHFPSVEKNGFQYLACSGDRSTQIYDQAKALEGKLDFVTMTAGGNDLCLVGARTRDRRRRRLD